MWPDPQVEKLVNGEFIPVRLHVREQADDFKRVGERYGAEWTPTTLMLDSSGMERHRIEGFLPVAEFVPQLEFGLARIEFSSGDFGAAEHRFRKIVEDSADADIAPEALYWAGVAKYKGAGDATALNETTLALRKRYPESSWTKKASVWAKD